MKKFLALFLALVVTVAVATSASAQIKFKDVPDDHWAAPAVYELVKLGVTKGYPDGTFRGTKQITRYETAVFLAKLANVIAGGDIKEDIAALKREVASLKKTPTGISGGYLASWKFCNVLAEAGSVRGALANYRLKLSSAHNLGEGASVKINLDTMDYGYFNDGQASFTTNSDLATQLLDIEGNLKLNMSALGIAEPVDLVLAVGPGNKKHAADPTGGDGVIPSEVDVTYMRPSTGVMAFTSLGGFDVAGGYSALGHGTSGRVTASEIVGSIGYGFSGVPLVNSLDVVTTGRYVSAGQFSSSTKDVRGSVAMAAPLGDKVEAGGTIGLGGNQQKNLMVSGVVALNDVMETGTVVVIRASKVGSEFLNSTNTTLTAAEWDFAGFDSFARPLTNNTVNIGGELVQSVSDDINLVGKGDVRLNSDYRYEAHNGRLTAEGGISYAVAPNTTLDAMYRVFRSKSSNDTTDVAALGLMYEF
ncbi:MAG: S-layer homology domain-containing protein [Candidatus Margulisiibacteriota bacterium]